MNQINSGTRAWGQAKYAPINKKYKFWLEMFSDIKIRWFFEPNNSKFLLKIEKIKDSQIFASGVIFIKIRNSVFNSNLRKSSQKRDCLLFSDFGYFYLKKNKSKQKTSEKNLKKWNLSAIIRFWEKSEKALLDEFFSLKKMDTRWR